MFFRIVIVSVFTLVSVSSGISADTLNSSQAARYNKLTHELIAPCCFREPIAIHRSEQSLQMLEEVRVLVAEGKSEKEIKAIYVERYGTRILADPPGITAGWLYLIPVVVFCTLVYLAVLRLRSLVAHATAPVPSVPPELVARVRKETEYKWNEGS